MSAQQTASVFPHLVNTKRLPVIDSSAAETEEILVLKSIQLPVLLKSVLKRVCLQQCSNPALVGCTSSPGWRPSTPGNGGVCVYAACVADTMKLHCSVVTQNESVWDARRGWW